MEMGGGFGNCILKLQVWGQKCPHNLRGGFQVFYMKICLSRTFCRKEKNGDAGKKAKNKSFDKLEISIVLFAAAAAGLGTVK